MRKYAAIGILAILLLATVSVLTHPVDSVNNSTSTSSPPFIYESSTPAYNSTYEYSDSSGQYNFTLFYNVLYVLRTNGTFSADTPIQAQIFIHLLYVSNGTGPGHGWLKIYNFTQEYSYVYFSNSVVPNNGSAAILRLTDSNFTASPYWQQEDGPSYVDCGPSAPNETMPLNPPLAPNCTQGGLGFYQAAGMIEFPIAGETYFHLIPSCGAPPGYACTPQYAYSSALSLASQENGHDNDEVFNIQPATPAITETFTQSNQSPVDWVIFYLIGGLGGAFGIVVGVIYLHDRRKERQSPSHLDGKAEESDKGGHT